MERFLTEEQQMIVDIARQITDELIIPNRAELDEKHLFPREILTAMAKADLFGIPIPEDYGGFGGSCLDIVLALEEIGRGCIGVGTAFAASALGIYPIMIGGSPEMKEKYLPEVAAGNKFAAFGLTEANAGSDAGGIRTTAVLDGDEWVLNGEKTFISGVRESLNWGGIHLMLTRTDPDPAAGHRAFTFFAVPLRGTEGLSPTFFEDMGRMGISTGGFALEDVRLPARHQVGELNRGFYHAMEGFSAARTLIGATCVGAAQAALELGMDHIKQREAFGRPLASFEGIQFPLADLYTELEEVRLITYQAAWTMDQKYKHEAATHHDIALAAAMTKLRAPVLGFKIMNEVADWFGAMAYTKECPVEMGIRGIRSYSIGAEGTPNIMRLIIARELLGKEFLPTALSSVSQRSGELDIPRQVM